MKTPTRKKQTPRCSVEGCENPRWFRTGDLQMCSQHFKEHQAAQPKQEPSAPPVEPPVIHKENVLDTPTEAPPSDPGDAPWMRVADLDNPARQLRALLSDISVILNREIRVRPAYAKAVEIQTVSEAESGRLWALLNPGCPHPFGTLERKGSRIFIAAPFIFEGKTVWGAVKDNGERSTINPWPGA